MERKVSYSTLAALDGQVVTEGHVKWCATFGHATYKKDGVESPECPRCGTNVEEEAEAIAEADVILAELFTLDPEYLEAARQGDLAACLEMDLYDSRESGADEHIHRNF